MSIAPEDLCGPYETVFDVGAFRGDFALACLSEWPECHVYSFEPLEAPPTGIASAPGWEWFTIALGNQTDVVEINRNVFVPSSSMLPMLELHERAFPYTKGSAVEAVPMSTIEEFGEMIVDRSLLKIDVQGYELEVLKGAGEWLTAFAGVVLEVSYEPLYQGAPSPAQLSEFLVEAGFRHKRTVDRLFHPKITDLLLQADELWVRE